VNWRLESKDPEAATEAEAIAAKLVVRVWTPLSALLHARAAIAANRPELAWGSLTRLAGALPNHPRGQSFVAPVLEIADALPEKMARDVRTRLGAGPPGAAGS
jgi:hypothetical protein